MRKCVYILPILGFCAPKVMGQIIPGLHGSFSQIDKAHIAHGVLMGLAIGIVFPLGGIMIRVFSFKGLAKWHAVWQSFGMVLLLVGYAVGAWLAYLLGEVSV
jgi:hypothetical protein